ncbi:MAG: 40S ribosomal protein S17 [Chaenotheca gracillima]|nr:MAG: 40S ribosomal protein S17 [Chaenotheca gracillima]
MLSTTSPPIKSILKKSQDSTAKTREEQNRETAIYHARLIQQRKDAEEEILTATETLLDFPSPLTTDPSCPATSDVKRFKELLEPFQPSDYDALIQERSIDGRCGYVLCPHPRQRHDSRGKLRILGGKRNQSFRVVPREKLEQWCSEDCAKRGLYVRVQLSEEPAWVRRSLDQSRIKLLGEVDQVDPHTISNEVAQLADQINDTMLIDSTVGRPKDLDSPSGGSANGGMDNVLNLTIRERNVGPLGRDFAPSITEHGEQDARHSLVEGYRPKTEAGQHPRQV